MAGPSQQPGLRKYMTDVMKFWVKEVGMDGFRCDVAGFVPIDFWNNVRAELDAIKPVFMLAEWETRDLHARAFDMTYAWSWQDKNSWQGAQYELYGDALENAIVLSFVSRGMPLIYNVQEAGNTKRLAFFDKDSIEWHKHPFEDLFRRLIELKKSHSTLWNGQWGADMLQVTNNAASSIFSFVRVNEQDKVFVAFNFSDEAKSVTFSGNLYPGEYSDFATGDQVVLNNDLKLDMPAWSYKIFTQ